MIISRTTALVLILSSCVEPYNYQAGSPNSTEALVVEGMITDQPGPYSVIVSKTIPVQSSGIGSGVVTGASVTISDDHGYYENLVEEESRGHFHTNFIQGVIGNSYTITVKTSEGYVYQSTAQKLLPVGDFTLKHEFKLKEDPNSNLQMSSTNGFDVSIDSEVLPEQEDRVWWRVTGTYHIYTFAYLRVRPADVGTGWVPDPPPCSGYTVFRGGIIYNRPCTCCDCWINEYNQIPLISDPRFIDSGKISNVPICFVEANRRTFFDKYNLVVEQLSLAKDVYDFWKRVQAQKSNSSNLFQTPPPKAGGNLAALTPNSIPVIGYFAASSIKKQTLVLDKSNVPYSVLNIDTIPQSCLDNWRISSTIRNSTNKKPAFW